MTATTDIKGVLRALAGDATDALAWLALADLIEEWKPGEMVKCWSCQGHGTHQGSAGDRYNPGCEECGGKGRQEGKGVVWRPNPDVARARAVPTLLAGEGRRVPYPWKRVERGHSWFDGGNRDFVPKLPDGMARAVLPAHLFRLVQPNEARSMSDYDAEADALAAFHSACLAFAFAACGLTPCPACGGRGEREYPGHYHEVLRCRGCKGLGHLP